MWPTSAPRSTSPDRVGRRSHRYLPLFYRLAAINSLLLLVAVGVTILILVPGHESSYKLDEEGLLLVVCVALVVVVNLVLLRRVVRPVQRLTAIARRVDLDDPAPPVPDATPDSEAGELSVTFNEMLARLRAERREATARVLAGQEAERLRIAQELHDQIGQELTAVLLLLSRVQAHASADLRPTVSEAQESVRAGLEDVRRIALELRPEALEDLGLESALAVLCDRLAERFGIAVSLRTTDELSGLSPDAELVIYRVAQEALTNAVRHSQSKAVDVSLERGSDRVVLSVRDHGRGLGRDGAAGTGIRGMRERAALVGGALEIRRADPAPGTVVRLAVPLEAPR